MNTRPMGGNGSSCAGLSWEYDRRYRPSSWILRSVWPLIWGWYPEDKLSVTPRSLKNAFQNWEMNWGPRSEIISSGIPKFLKTW